MEHAGGDARLSELGAWLGEALGTGEFRLQTASADASFRRYFRAHARERTWIVMDAPPDREDVRPFIAVGELLRGAGVHAPKILAREVDRGFLLLEDLGETTYLDALAEDNAEALFADAIDALIAWQVASAPGVLPDYTNAELRREMQLFSDWYLGRHLGVCLSREDDAALATDLERIVTAVQEQPKVFVHRDYMPRNLMVSQPNPGVIDFQDARYGPLAYDVLSLFKDAFTSWPERAVGRWIEAYRQRARDAGVPVPPLDRLWRDVDWIGVQRHLKVLGIFARIRYRDGKPGYLEDAPRFVRYLRDELARLPELAALTRIFERYVEHEP